MPKDTNGHWYPDLFDLQLDVFNTTKRAVLVSGARLSGKTVVSLHKIVRHLWETPDALVAMFSRTMKNSHDGGPWRKMQKTILPEWIKANIGLRYTTYTQEGRPGPKVNGQTRTPYFRIRNSHGGESECMLFSLDDVKEVEDKLKEMEFSMIYFSELDKFDDRKVLSVSLPCLRMQHLSYDQMQWLADCNPSEDGESSWIYKVWYRERTQSYEEYRDETTKLGLPTLPEDLFLEFQRSLDLIEINPPDNPRLDPRQLQEIKTQYAYDKGLYARYVEGKWIYGDGDQSRHFRGNFNQEMHTLGNVSSADEDEWSIILPSENCTEPVLGFDMGDVNHAAVILERKEVNGRPAFVLLDECVTLGEEISNEQFIGELFMPKLEALEIQVGHQFKLESNWADSSMLDRYSAAGGGTYQADEVEIASKGRIQLMGIKKGPGSVRARVQLIKKLLHQKRLLISAHCTHTIKMLKDLKKGKGPLDYVLRTDQNKHIFDALSYALLGECGEESTTVTLGAPSSAIVVQAG